MREHAGLTTLLAELCPEYAAKDRVRVTCFNMRSGGICIFGIVRASEFSGLELADTSELSEALANWFRENDYPVSDVNTSSLAITGSTDMILRMIDMTLLAGVKYEPNAVQPKKSLKRL